ncbi:11_t:CDS:2, partial [Diversispora eburnea]
ATHQGDAFYCPSFLINSSMRARVEARSAEIVPPESAELLSIILPKEEARSAELLSIILPKEEAHSAKLLPLLEALIKISSRSDRQLRKSDDSDCDPKTSLII